MDQDQKGLSGVGLGGSVVFPVVSFCHTLDLHNAFLCFINDALFIKIRHCFMHVSIVLIFRLSHVFAHATYGQALYVMQPTPGGTGFDCLELSWPCMSVLVSQKCIAAGHENMKHQECIEYPTP